MEEKFRTTVSIFLPAGQFVIDGERDTFVIGFAVVLVTCKSDKETVLLETQRHVEVF